MNKYVNVEFVNTPESYSQITFFGNNNIAIPYININLMPDNPITHRNSFVDYSYYVLIGVKSMEYKSDNDKGKLNFIFDLANENLPTITEYIVIGNYDYKSVWAEVKIECMGIHYYTLDNSKISFRQDDFIPYQTPNFKQTLDVNEIERFFSFQNLPDEIRATLGDNISSIIWK